MADNGPQTARAADGEAAARASLAEYGILLLDGTVAPASTVYFADSQARALGKPVVVVKGAEQHVVPTSRPDESHLPWRQRSGCPEPSHSTLHRHRKKSEPICGRCRGWWAEYERSRAARRKKASS